MRSQEEINARLNQMIKRQLSERKKKFLSRSPNNCIFNQKVRIYGNGTVGICENKEKFSLFNSGIFVCDTIETCKECSCFSCKHTEESVEADFQEVLKNPSVCGQEYPKIAMLLWVLIGERDETPWYVKLLQKLTGSNNGRQ